MSRLRRRIAERLKAAQNTAAMLTTFNEIDMTQTMALYRQVFRTSIPWTFLIDGSARAGIEED